MLQRIIGPILTGAGVLTLAVSLLANVIGRFPIGQILGFSRNPAFGPQQTTGTIIGVAVLMLGIWFWRRGAQAKFGSVSYAIAALAFAVVIGGPIYVVANRDLQPSAAVVACVEVESLPSSAEGAGHKRVDYGVRIVNTGKVRVHVDSVVLMALRALWLPQSEVIAIDDMALWEKVDSVTVRPSAPGRWLLRPGNKFPSMRSLIVPIEQLSPLYWFHGIVFLRHAERPIVRRSAVNWIDNFPQECP